MSYLDAISTALNNTIAECVATGAIVFVGQFGHTICQYPDRYIERAGLASVINPGQYKPQPTFTGAEPNRPGILGELLVSEDGLRQVFWDGKGWIRISGR